MKITKLLVFCFFAILFSVSVHAQETKISGKILDENGNPIPGATILVKGTSNGTTSDFNGNYEIKAASGGTLVFSFIGYLSIEESLKGRTKIDVNLIPVAQQLDEVVVTALGIKREEKALGYAVQKVSGESLQKVKGIDVATSLTGKVAGLLVKNSSEFSATPVLSIRGESPLLVIDGVAYNNKDLGDISSEDIESMSVLKGATASALYGFRGASGAILITTKNGSSGAAGISVDLSTNTMYSAGFLAIPEKQSTYGRGSNGTYDKNSDSSWGAVMAGQILNQWDPFLKAYRDYEYLPIGKDNFANFLEQGYITNNNVNVGFKQENISLRSSVNWTQNKGQYPNSKLDKYTYTFGGEVKLDKFKLNSNLSYSRKASPNVGSSGYTAYDPMYSLLIWSAADFDIRDYKDNYWITPGQVQNYTYRSGSDNPYFLKNEKINETSRDIFNADLSMSYDITDWLKATVRTGLDFFTDKGEIRVSKGSYQSTGNSGVPGNSYLWVGGTTGAYAIGETQGHSINSDLLLTGERSYNKFNVDYLAGGTIYYTEAANIYGNTDGGISIPGFFSLAASVNPAKVYKSQQQRQVNSVFGRLGLSWDKTVYLEFTARNDWSSTLAVDANSYFYPSVASSFVISELLPESTKDWLDLLKLRTSWTQSKNIPGIYEINSSFKINSGTWNTLNGAEAPSSLFPSNITPSSADTFEVGTQGMMFKNRLMVDVSYYSKRFYDGIINGPISSASGYTSIKTNSEEETLRRGWEVTLNTTPIKTKDWQLDLGMNWSTYKRTYSKLDPLYSSVKPWVAVGERIDAYVGRDFLKDPATGAIIYNNGRIAKSGYDSVFGYSDPDWLWGVNSTLKHKDFSLFLSFDGVSGGMMTTRTESYMWNTGGHPDSVTPERALDVATPGSQNYIGEGVKIVSGTVTYDAVGNITTDTRVFAPNDIPTTYKQAMLDLHSGSAWGGTGTRADAYSKTFFKLREISLTYTFPSKYLQGWAAKAASVSFIGQNVLMKAKDFKYSDPDGGYEDFSDPSVRYLGANFKLTF
ncbi:SusC/RagA family TonB-linked outer membrane protein [Lutibacter sp.]|uniref:SusC/RagA family TonB-linked outer membrane protein n=1 Tax=Lutibacter sp. TaxID=1925666 RepID=UPI002737383C|nr:SusC/RagA family TonB-linked outer membrane protein [Lutibacter sp.]MDP3313696.1 SusC/RagA family TonB-linked outer membrane protein [Lutibacter sp.]